MVVSFSGHRSCKAESCAALEGVIEGLALRGYTTFISGMAEGFDIIAAEAVLALKRRGVAVSLVCAVPFRGHEMTMPSAAWRKRYADIIAAADNVVVLSESYSVNSYRERNDYLVERADALVCYYSGKSVSGTGYTVKKALKKCIEVVNIYADGVQIRFFG